MPNQSQHTLKFSTSYIRTANQQPLDQLFNALAHLKAASTALQHADTDFPRSSYTSPRESFLMAFWGETIDTLTQNIEAHVFEHAKPQDEEQYDLLLNLS